MALNSEVSAIIGGSVAGAVVLIAILAIIIYLLCCRKRQNRQLKSQKFRQMSPHPSPSHSQPSTNGYDPSPSHRHPSNLGYGPYDPQLPKVSSNGLWMGASGMYVGMPSSAYFHGRPILRPPGISRTSSETINPQVPYEDVYISGGNNQRIYHSQQLYEAGHRVYDFYQMAGSRSELLPASQPSQADKTSRKVNRSASEVTHKAQRPSRRDVDSEKGRRSKKPSVTMETAKVHQIKQDEPGHLNRAFVNDTQLGENLEENKIASMVGTSATDSMKLLANNKTDDQKTMVQAPILSPGQMSEVSPISQQHCVNEDDISAKPLNVSIRRSESENPILARMQDMVIDKSEDTIIDPVTVIAEATEPLLITSHFNANHSPFVVHNPIFQDGEEVNNLDYSRNEENVNMTSGFTKSTNELVELGSKKNRLTDDCVKTSVTDSVDNVTGNKNESGINTQSNHSIREAEKVKDDHIKEDIGLSIKDELSKTTAAFQFLDTYLSDDEDEIEQSPHMTP